MCGAVLSPGSCLGVWSGGFHLACPCDRFFVPLLAFFGLWWVLLPLWCQKRKLGELGIGGKVLIRTVLGTMAVFRGFMAGVVALRDFTGAV